MNKDLIESKGLPYSPNLTMIPTQKNCIYPTKEQVFNLFAKYYLFATLATTDYDLEYFNFIYRNLNTMYNFESFFSGKDKELLNKLLNKDLSLLIIPTISFIITISPYFVNIIFWIFGNLIFVNLISKSRF